MAGVGLVPVEVRRPPIIHMYMEKRGNSSDRRNTRRSKWAKNPVVSDPTATLYGTLEFWRSVFTIQNRWKEL